MKNFRSIQRQLRRGNLKTVPNTLTGEMDLMRKSNSGKWIKY